MTSEQMVAVLRHLLPAGAVLTDAVPISRGEIQVSYDDGHGPVTLSVTANLSTRQYTAPTVELPRQCPSPLRPDAVRRPAGAPPVSCVLHTLADGTLERLRVTPDDQRGLWDYEVMDFRPDGIEVDIVVGNAIVPLAALGLGGRRTRRRYAINVVTAVARFLDVTYGEGRG
jgi:hypothetical protein